MSLFEGQIRFQLPSGEYLDGGVFVGSTEFLPLRVLRDDDEALKSEFDDWLSLEWAPRQDETRQRILEATGCLQRYEDLCEAVEKRTAVPIVGAGMSVASGLPTWTDFLCGVVTSVEHDSVRLAELLHAGRFEDAAQVIADAAGLLLLNEKIEHLLRLPKGAEVTGPVCLLPEIFNDIVVTTNLDEVLEAVYFPYVTERLPSLKGIEISKYPSARGNGPLALKLHGDRTDPKTRVLLPREYEDNYGERGKVRRALELLYQTQQVVFMGCSLVSDRTMQLLDELANSGTEMPRHYALLEVPEHGSERSERELFLTARGVFPIWYTAPHDEAMYALLDGMRVAADKRVTQ